MRRAEVQGKASAIALPAVIVPASLKFDAFEFVELQLKTELLRDGFQAHVARLDPDCGPRRGLRLVRHHSRRGIYVRSYRTQKHVPDLCGSDWRVCVPLFRNGGHSIPAVVFIAIVLSLIPHDMLYGPQAALIAEAFTPRLRYSGASLGYQLDHRRRPGADHCDGLVRHLPLRLCHCDLHRSLRHREPGFDSFHAGLHRQGYFGGV